MDPVAVLPPETTSQILSYLTPQMLLEASKVSKRWRDCALQSQLWRQKYAAEGWAYNAAEVANFEKTLLLRGGLQKEGRSRNLEALIEPRGLKRKARDIGNSHLGGVTSQPLIGTQDDSVSELRTHQKDPADQYDYLQDSEMQDVDSQSSTAGIDGSVNLSDCTHTQESIQSEELPSPNSTYDQNSVDGSLDKSYTGSGYSIDRPSLVFPSFSGSPRLNFHNVYKQRKRLEENWSAGKYKSFQLPHASHPEEAHTECVYTIQYSGNYLVSGSRDRTLRIWNLETQRLLRGPLTGHTGSVLCLQFDEKEDIIISGSSDTDVVIWQFSTGEMIRKISQAHKESVLNLKFDKRFLVTCSKDKTIRIWNRNPLRPGDKDYPVRGVLGGGKCSDYIIDLRSFSSPYDVEQHLSPLQKEPIPEYSTIMTIDSHGAAVNAVHIYNDQLVSASGDRTLKVWDIHSGVCTAICTGHTKGIACVQYDGMRVVSGSSDNTIRIFDPISQVEVGCLEGHSKLVRTIQAAFGDTAGSQEDLEEEARAADRKFFEAKQAGEVSDVVRRAHRNRDRNAGSSRPEDIMAIGAKLPPGGGGNRWGRIVSGSYDETIIIWKKSADGRWIIGHRLNQGDALRAAGPAIFAHSDRVHRAGGARHLLQHHGYGPLVVPPAPIALPNGHPLPQGTQPPPGHMAVQQIQPQLAAQQIMQQAIQNSALALQTNIRNMTGIQPVLNPANAQHLLAAGATMAQVQAYQRHQLAMLQQVNNQAQTLQRHITQAAQVLATHGQQPPAHQPLGQAVSAQQLQPPQPAVPQIPTVAQHQSVQQALPQQDPSQQPLTQQTTTSSQQPPPVQQVPQQAPPQLQPHPAVLAQPPAPGAALQQAPANPNIVVGQPNARVFKLQFDARRIICCSQDPKIVGWDFANSDEEIIECSRFFAPPT